MRKHLLAFAMAIGLAMTTVAASAQQPATQPPPAVQPSKELAPFMGSWQGNGVETCGFRKYSVEFTPSSKPNVARGRYDAEQIACEYRVNFYSSSWNVQPGGKLVYDGTQDKTSPGLKLFVFTLSGNRLNLEVIHKATMDVEHKATLTKR